MTNRAIIEAAIKADPTATTEEKARLLAALLPITDKPKMISRKEVAAMMGVHVESVKRYTRAGLLKPVHFTARAVRYPEAEVLDFMRRGVKL